MMYVERPSEISKFCVNFSSAKILSLKKLLLKYNDILELEYYK